MVPDIKTLIIREPPNKREKKADKKIAEVVYAIQDKQVEELNEENDAIVRGLVEKLNSFPTKVYTKRRILTHLEEIKEPLNGMIEWYNEHGKTPPKLHPLYFMNLVIN